MAIFGPTREELVSELSVILELEGEKIPPKQQVESEDFHLAQWLKRPCITIVCEAEYHHGGLNIYGYRIIKEEDLNQCLTRERIRVILDDGTGIALDSSVNPKDFLYYRKGRWTHRANDLYIAINYH